MGDSNEKQTTIKKKKKKHTVDGQSNDLGQTEAVGTLEGRDLARGVQLGVLSRLVELSARVRLSANQLEVQVVALRSNKDGDGAAVFLYMAGVSCVIHVKS